MADINRQLKEYLSRNGSKGDNESLLPITVRDISLPKFSSWFQSKSESPDVESSTSSSSWFKADQNDPCLPSMGRKQRILGFILFMSLGGFCFGLAAVYAPLLLLKARKFALLFTLGSFFCLQSFSFLWGPVNHLKYIISADRIMFSSAYFISLFATLYFALSLQSTTLTIVSAVIQVSTLICFIISNIPGGAAGLKFMSNICSSICKKSVSRVLPI